MTLEPVQIAVFLFLTGLIGWVTYLKCKDQPRSADSNREYFLAGGGLSWIFVAGSITLTNLSTDQLVGMNGSQMLLVALWEFSAVVGLFILAYIFIPIYYKYECTTTTELLEKRYNNKHIRATISLLFLAANVFVFLPAVLYTGSLFMKSVFGFEFSLMYIAIGFAALGAAYSIFGGLRAVAVSDTFSGILLLGLALMVVYLALDAINFDFSGIPKERLTLVGDSDSDIPWHTLLTGMLLIQTFYWSTNQVITQRAMAAPTVSEAKKGVIAAAFIRLLIVPPIIVIPGIVAFKLFGDVGDAAYGQIVGDLLPPWLVGAFAAAITAAVLTSFNSMLNSSVALYVCDIHEKYITEDPDVPKLSGWITLIFTVIALLLVPVFQEARSIIDTLQKLWGIFSMPILSTFVVGLVFKNVNAWAAIIAALVGAGTYAFFLNNPLGIQGLPHYIHLMFINFFWCIAVALLINKFIFRQKSEFVLGKPLLA
ncbi:MAG: SLC5 family protein [Gammaproteobacteria bacterium]|nr:SLC5 family protein [Gammaproteobacteria bacterium]NNC97568.1 SLC5 family protein [Gammaproteobacteria bacterium]NNM14977.1 SLC5 family protein [Gammaproteobacteria bacterium]